MNWLDARDIRVIHANLIAEHGGLTSHARTGALGYALQAPQTALAENPILDTAAIAATYAWTFARSQVFADGNLRLALAASLVFLANNGIHMTANPCEVVSIIREAQRGSVTFAEFSGWFEQHSSPPPLASKAPTRA